LDISHAVVDDEALEQLQACSDTHHLPAMIDPSQRTCTISVLAPRRQHTTSRPELLAA
jgi:hypothetical protein